MHILAKTLHITNCKININSPDLEQDKSVQSNMEN